MSKSTDRLTITTAPGNPPVVTFTLSTPDDFPTDDVWISAGEFTRTRGDDTYAFVTRNIINDVTPWDGRGRWQIIHYPKPMLNGNFEVLAEGVCKDIPEAKAVSMAWLALHG